AQPGQPAAPAQPTAPREAGDDRPQEGQRPGAQPGAQRPSVPRPIPLPANQQTSVRKPGTAPRTAAGARRPAQPLRAGAPSATVPPRRGAVAAGDGRGGSRRGLLLVIGAVILVLAAGAFALTQLSGGGDDEPSTATTTPAVPARQDDGNAARETPRAETTVAVLNGTTIPGLARSVADRIEAAGYRIGSVTNAPDQQRAATQVAYQPGNERAAQAVAEIIDAGSDAVVPIDEVTSATAGDEAVVVVTVGADQSP
ncbi:MAG TPA: LytR C-terminal domain-containing protein, partial [Capillimicrobium sp.]|nr:LytR C-terminal domain-containing protein [Capillimicrobium sp.]